MSQLAPSTTTSGDSTPRGNQLLGSIFLISVLGLFLEMLLIRWIGTEVRIFSYLQNTILVVCFLGLGMGCFTSRQPIGVRRMLLALLALTAILAHPMTYRWACSISSDLSVLSDFVIWQYNPVETTPWQAAGYVIRGLLLTFGLMVLVWEIFVPIGRLLGRLMDDCPRTILGYSVNVAGSLVGIWLFVLLSAWCLPPVAWFVVLGGMLAWMVGNELPRGTKWGLIAAIVGFGWLAGFDPAAIHTLWSPYQKLALHPVQTEEFRIGGDYFIHVNNVGYQGMVDLSPEATSKDPSIPEDMIGLSQYDVPLLMKPNPRNVLIVGAGSGNDVAGALRGGAEHVTAVEIDPAIIAMGRKYHPERPYDSDRVTVVNDDARSFFATTGEKYDLIIFGLLDSHTTTSMTNARLDHYVYTRESIERAKDLLTDDGIVVLTFMVQEPFIADRISRTLKEVFDEEPLVFNRDLSRLGWGGTAFVAGNQEVIAKSLADNPRLAAAIVEWRKEWPVDLPHTTPLATDDWPYIYLEKPGIPVLYYLLGGMLACLFFYGQWRLKLHGMFTGWQRSEWHFFFLGAAFLLLEVQNISKAAVVLGNTWWVNAVIISGVLMMVLLANLLAAKLPRISSTAVAVCLIGSCIGLYFVDLSRFAFLPYPAKATIVGALTALPMLFSGVFFIRSFASVSRKDLALGANLIGALVGAVLQSVTFLVGIKALLLIVAALYLAAVLTQPAISLVAPARERKDETGSEPQPEIEPEPQLAHSV